MNEIEILLEKEIDSDLGSRNKIEELYKNIDSNVSKVVMNFKGVEFMGRSFAQEYLNQKHSASFEVVEVNVPDDVQKLFNVILKINESIVFSGITDATDELAKKQLKSKLNKIRSDTYLDIFLKLGDKRLMTFKKSEVKDFLTIDENRVFNDFLKRAKELEIIESIGRNNSGEYGFVNRLYFTYFMMLSNVKNLKK